MGQMEIAASSLSTKLQGSDHQNFATLIQKIDDSESHGDECWCYSVNWNYEKTTWNQLRWTLLSVN